MSALRRPRRHRRLRLEALEDRHLLAALSIIDNGDANYTQAGTWTAYSTAGYSGDLSYAASGAGTSTATWAFSGLTALQTYLVWGTWVTNPNRATNAPFSLYNGAVAPANLVSTAAVNQQVAPNDYYDSSASWELLGQVLVCGANLNVQLTNLANGYVIADAVAVQPLVAPTPAATTAIVDNGDAAYTQVGAWTNYLQGGYAGDLAYAPAGTGCCTATWQFTGLTPGATYDVSSTWLAHPNRATNAPFGLYNGVVGPANLVATVPVNQQLPPGDFYNSGVWWEQLGSVTPSGTTLNVRLTDVANGYVIADAVQLRSATPAAAQDIAVLVDGVTNVPDGTGSVAFGSTPVGTPMTRTFTVQNVGGSALTLTPPITVPAGFTASGFGSTTLAPSGSTTFTVTLTALVAGPYSGTLTFANDDPDENPYNFTISGTVTSPVLPGAIIIDNGDPGYSSAPRWHDWAYGGYGGDVQWAARYTCCVATWSVTGLTPGNYRVSTTWVPNTNRATNAPYRIYDGLTSGTLLATVRIDQQQAPNDFADMGVNWDDLGVGVYTVSGTTLTVTLADDSNNYVIADAIRVERVSPLLAGDFSADAVIGETLTTGTELDGLLQTAVQRWIGTGLSSAEAAALQVVTIKLTDLPSGLLGGATTVGILLDQNANGRGWFADSSPWEDGEFVHGAAPAGVDLLTVVMHELGHMLGRPDVDAAATTDDLMALRLVSQQTRRLPDGVLVAGQNPLLSGDVDGDGVVRPLDVLLLVNQINGGGGPLTPVQSGGPLRYFDVTGDQRLTASDVLTVINCLNVLLGARGGETSPPIAGGQAASGPGGLAAVAAPVPDVTSGAPGVGDEQPTGSSSAAAGDGEDLLDLAASLSAQTISDPFAHDLVFAQLG